MKNEKTTIQISTELRQKLKLLAVSKNSNYENLLDELVVKELSKMNLDGFAKKSKVKKK